MKVPLSVSLPTFPKASGDVEFIRKDMPLATVMDETLLNVAESVISKMPLLTSMLPVVSLTRRVKICLKVEAASSRIDALPEIAWYPVIVLFAPVPMSVSVAGSELYTFIPGVLTVGYVLPYAVKHLTVWFLPFMSNTAGDEDTSFHSERLAPDTTFSASHTTDPL